jgi:type VI protein secretion system component VasK
MNEFEQHEQAAEPLRTIDVEFPGRRNRRLALGAVTAVVVVVLVLWGVLFASMNDKVRQLDKTTAAQSVQIHQLQGKLANVDASLGAAVACLQTVGSLEGLCSKLVK